MPFIPHTDDDEREMLAAIGAPSIEVLIDSDAVPNREGTSAIGSYEYVPIKVNQTLLTVVLHE